MVDLFKIEEKDNKVYVKMLVFDNTKARVGWVYNYIQMGEIYPELTSSQSWAHDFGTRDAAHRWIDRNIPV